MMLRIADQLEFGRDLVRRIDVLSRQPTGRAGERVEVWVQCAEFVHTTERIVVEAAFVEPGDSLSLEQLLELLELLSRVGLALSSGLFEVD